MLDEPDVEIFATKVHVIGSGLDLKDTLLDSQKGYIEHSSTEIEDEHVPLATENSLLIETVSDSGGSQQRRALIPAMTPSSLIA